MEKNDSNSNLPKLTKKNSIDKDHQLKVLVDLQKAELANKTPIQVIVENYSDTGKDNYIFHTRVILDYDEEEAFIFVLKNCLVFTHIFNEKNTELKTIPAIYYVIKFQQIYFYDIQINETLGNKILIQFYENDFVKKSEL